MTELKEGPIGDREQGMESFREEIRGVSDFHLQAEDFSLEDLTDADREIWEAVKQENITREQLETYRKSILKGSVRESELLPDIPKSRGLFLGYVTGLAGAIFVEKELGEMDRSNA